MKKNLKILVLGCSGFIGSHLISELLKEKKVELYGLDLDNENIKAHLSNKKFFFKYGDINKNQKWIKDKIKKCDIIIPLIAIATPNIYMKEPLKVFELDLSQI